MRGSWESRAGGPGPAGRGWAGRGGRAEAGGTAGRAGRRDGAGPTPAGAGPTRAGRRSALDAGQTKRRGFTHVSWNSTAQWRCGPVEFPVTPT